MGICFSLEIDCRFEMTYISRLLLPTVTQHLFTEETKMDACLIGFVLALICIPENDTEVPVATWEFPADALHPVNGAPSQVSSSNVQLGYDLSIQGEMKDWIQLERLNKPIVDSRGRLQGDFREIMNRLEEGNAAASTLLPSILAPESSLTSKKLPTEILRDFGRTPQPTSWGDDAAAFNHQVAATVNGEAIPNGEVLDRYIFSLKKFRDAMQRAGRSEAEYKSRRIWLVEKELPAAIQRNLVAREMERTATRAVLESTKKDVLQAFDEKFVPRLMRDFEADSLKQLDQALIGVGSSLSDERKMLVMAGMAKAYVQLQLSWDWSISKADVETYYHAHLDDYNKSASVDWEQIQITFFGDAAKASAQESAKLAQQELEKGHPVAEVAAKYSDGPTAKQGGQWKSMVVGTFPDSKLEAMLFEMAIGNWSQIYETGTEFQLVRVTSRSEAGVVPLANVEKEIRQALNTKRVMNLLNRMFREATIESEHDVSEARTNKLPVSQWEAAMGLK